MTACGIRVDQEDHWHDPSCGWRSKSALFGRRQIVAARYVAQYETATPNRDHGDEIARSDTGAGYGRTALHRRNSRCDAPLTARQDRRRTSTDPASPLARSGGLVWPKYRLAHASRRLSSNPFLRRSFGIADVIRGYWPSVPVCIFENDCCQGRSIRYRSVWRFAPTSRALQTCPNRLTI